MRREEKPPKQLPAARECGPAVWSKPFTGRSRVHFMTRRSVLPIGTVGGAEVTADSAERGVCSGARTASPGDGRILGICSGSRHGEPKRKAMRATARRIR